jgi:hypothetical protein
MFRYTQGTASQPRLSIATCVALLLASFAAGCHRDHHINWPKSAGTEAVKDWTTDGGQSIAPHQSVATAIEDSSDSSPPVVTATLPSSGTAKSDVITSDEIIIDLTDTP